MFGNSDVEFLIDQEITSERAAAIVPMRILLFADAVSASSEIFFSRAAREFQKGRLLRVETVEEKRLDELDGSPVGPFIGEGSRRALRSLFAEVAPNLVVFLRYGGRHGEYIVELARHAGARIAYVVDDALLDIPIRIGIEKYRFRNNPYRIRMVERLLRAVDLIYSATDRLTENLVEKGFEREKMATCRSLNYVGIRRPPSVRSASVSETVRVGYAGTSSHSFELKLLVPMLTTLCRLFPKIEIEIVGNLTLPKGTSGFISNLKTYEKVDTLDKYLKFMEGRKWDLGFVPLVDDVFNQCKTEVKWLEYTNAGIPTLASPVGVYADLVEKGCAIPVRNGDWTGSAIETLLDVGARQQAIDLSVRLVDQRYRKGHRHLEFLRFLGKSGLKITSQY